MQVNFIVERSFILMVRRDFGRLSCLLSGEVILDETTGSFRIGTTRSFGVTV